MDAMNHLGRHILLAKWETRMWPYHSDKDLCARPMTEQEYLMTWSQLHVGPRLMAGNISHW